MTTDEEIICKSSVTGRQGLFGPLNRDQLVTDSLAAYPIPLTDWRVWDAMQTVLPGTSATDDLGLYTGTFGTKSPWISLSDQNAVGSIGPRYARTLFQLPANYNSGESVRISFTAGMILAAAATSSSIDCEAYLIAPTSGLVSGSDLVTTAAITTQTTTTFADVEFSLTSTALTPGAFIDVRVSMTCNSNTATSHYFAFIRSEFLCNKKG